MPNMGRYRISSSHTAPGSTIVSSHRFFRRPPTPALCFRPAPAFAVFRTVPAFFSGIFPSPFRASSGFPWLSPNRPRSGPLTCYRPFSAFVLFPFQSRCSCLSLVKSYHSPPGKSSFPLVVSCLLLSFSILLQPFVTKYAGFHLCSPGTLQKEKGNPPLPGSLQKSTGMGDLLILSVFLIPARRRRCRAGSTGLSRRSAGRGCRAR